MEPAALFCRATATEELTCSSVRPLPLPATVNRRRDTQVRKLISAEHYGSVTNVRTGNLCVRVKIRVKNYPQNRLDRVSRWNILMHATDVKFGTTRTRY